MNSEIPDVILPVFNEPQHDIDAEQDGLHSLAIDGIDHNSNSFLLLDSSERIRVNEANFLKRLKVDPNDKFKVVSIVGKIMLQTIITFFLSKPKNL